MSCSSRNEVARRRRGIFALAGWALAGCGALGEGAGPSGLTLVNPEGTAAPYEMSECAAAEALAIGHWRGDETFDVIVNATASWTSSNPSAVLVSDGRTPLANGAIHPAGTLVARAPGAARIAVDYLEFSASLLVTVKPILEQRIVPEVTHLAPGSTETFELEVHLDAHGPWVKVQPQWSLPHAQAAAIIDAATGQLTALSGPEDVPFPIEARLGECGVAATRELRVGPVAALDLSYEHPPEQTLPLEVSTLIRVFARFVDDEAEPQDLTDQVEINLEDTDADTVRYSVSSHGVVLEGLRADATAQLSLRYAPLGLSVLTERYVFGEIEQQSLRLDPEHASLSFPDELQLQAVGGFADGIDRIVTREAEWTVSDAQVAGITSGASGGLLAVTQDVDQDVTVEAFMTIDGRTVSGESQVQITRSDGPAQGP